MYFERWLYILNPCTISLRFSHHYYYFAQAVDYESVFIYKFVLINMYSNNVILKNMLTGWDVNSLRFLRSKRKTFHCFPLDFFGGTPVQFI